MKVFKPLSFALFHVRNRFFATRVPFFTAMVASATCSRLFSAASLCICAVHEINLPSPPLSKGDFAPFQEMYLTSGIISCWNAARCDSLCGINGLLGFSHYYPINYKYPHFWFQHSLVCWLLFLILVWVDRVKIREIILRNNLNFNDRRHGRQEIYSADRLGFFAVVVLVISDGTRERAIEGKCNCFLYDHFFLAISVSNARGIFEQIKTSI